MLSATTCAIRLKDAYRKTRLSDCRWQITDKEEEGIEAATLLNV